MPEIACGSHCIAATADSFNFALLLLYLAEVNIDNICGCKQVLWTQPASLQEPLKWSSYVWRRGTVPIWWGVELKSGGVGEANIVIPSATPYRGTRRCDCTASMLSAAACCSNPHSPCQSLQVCSCVALWGSIDPLSVCQKTLSFWAVQNMFPCNIQQLKAKLPFDTLCQCPTSRYPMCRYFRRLQKRYTPNPIIKAALSEGADQPDQASRDGSSQDPSLQLPITCINLLRCSMQVY